MDTPTLMTDEQIEAAGELALVAMLTDAGLTWPEIRAYLRARSQQPAAN